MQLPLLSDLKNDPFLLRFYQTDKNMYLSTRWGTNQKFLQQKRVKTAFGLLKKFLPPAPCKVADIACGTADVGLLLAEAGFEVDLIDNQSKFIEYLKLKHSYGKANFIHADLKNLSAQSQYTAIYFGEALEHMAYPTQVLVKLRDALISGGYLCLTTPNGDFVDVYEPHWSAVKNDTVRNEKLANTVGNHVCEFTMQELKDLVKQSGFTVMEHRLILSSQASKRHLLRRLLPKTILWALDDRWSQKKTRDGKFFGRTQVLIAQKV